MAASKAFLPAEYKAEVSLHLWPVETLIDRDTKFEGKPVTFNNARLSSHGNFEKRFDRLAAIVAWDQLFEPAQ